MKDKERILTYKNGILAVICALGLIYCVHTLLDPKIDIRFRQDAGRDYRFQEAYVDVSLANVTLTAHEFTNIFEDDSGGAQVDFTLTEDRPRTEKRFKILSQGFDGNTERKYDGDGEPPKEEAYVLVYGKQIYRDGHFWSFPKREKPLPIEDPAS